MRETKLTAEEILSKHENENEYHFHKSDKQFIVLAMTEFANQQTASLQEELERVKKELNSKQPSNLQTAYNTLFKQVSTVNDNYRNLKSVADSMANALEVQIKLTEYLLDLLNCGLDNVEDKFHNESKQALESYNQLNK